MNRWIRIHIYNTNSKSSASILAMEKYITGLNVYVYGILEPDKKVSLLLLKNKCLTLPYNVCVQVKGDSTNTQ